MASQKSFRELRELLNEQWRKSQLSTRRSNRCLMPCIVLSFEPALHFASITGRPWAIACNQDRIASALSFSLYNSCREFTNTGLAVTLSSAHALFPCDPIARLAERFLLLELLLPVLPSWRPPVPVRRTHLLTCRPGCCAFFALVKSGDNPRGGSPCLSPEPTGRCAEHGPHRL